MLAKENQALVMEALGVFALCFVGGWSVEWSIEGKASVTAVALAHGFVLGLFVYLAASISGYMKFEDCIRYILAQVSGSAIAGFVLFLMRPEFFAKTRDARQLGHPSLPDDVDTSIGAVCEALATGMLVLCVMSAGVHKKAPATVTATMVGSSLLLGVLSIGNATGAALNPARVIGPAFFSGRIVERGSLIYYFGPIIGGCLTALIYKYFFMEYESSIFAPVDNKSDEDTMDKPFIDS